MPDQKIRLIVTVPDGSASILLDSPDLPDVALFYIRGFIHPRVVSQRHRKGYIKIYNALSRYLGLPEEKEDENETRSS